MPDAPATIHAIVSGRARDAPSSPVLGAPGRRPLTASGLLELVSGVGVLLRERGIGPSGRVALVTRNGPEAASAFLAVAAMGACAPLNPLYRVQELEFALEDLHADAVIVDSRLDTPIRGVAEARAIPVLELEATLDGPAGSFRLEGAALPAPGGAEDQHADAVALLLHTSGTTSRPKLVPLTQANLVASARNVAAKLELAPADVCLNVMPLFHIHGLVTSVLATAVAGASVSCSPGFDALEFPRQLAECGATWTTAVPTMYHSLLHALHDRPEAFAGHGLRFVRSSSAALPVPLLQGLEEALGVPVVEAYGMTEAAHQMTSNPLPPARRIPGSVGIAAGPEVTILDELGEQLSPGSVGEIAIRGDNVFVGYEANPEANASAFSGPWFRTGDEGRLDDDGYLHLRGRLKEIINRGGEKIAPREVDEALAAHPAVAQIVTFAMPDERLGEDVAAAVVLTAGRTVTERELQVFAVERLAPFKVPRRIVVLDEIPKGATGKLQRIGLAEKLGLTAVADAPDADQAHSMLEMELCKIWADELGVEWIGARDDFFALGGDSLRGAQLVGRIRDLCGRPELPLIALVRAPTVERMLRELREDAPEPQGLLVPFGADSGTPLFLVHGVIGDIVGFAALAARLGPDRALVGIRAHGVDGDGDGPATVEEMASAYLGECRRLQPSGPYRIGGFCMGGPIAVEMARILAAVGEQVDLLLIDPRVAPPRDPRSLSWTVRRRLREGDLRRAALSRRRRAAEAVAQSETTPTWARLARARDTYEPRPTDVPAWLVTSSDHEKWGVPPSWWDRYLRGGVHRLHVAGTHDRLLHVPHVDRLAVEVARALDEMP